MGCQPPSFPESSWTSVFPYVKHQDAEMLFFIPSTAMWKGMTQLSFTAGPTYHETEQKMFEATVWTTLRNNP